MKSLNEKSLFVCESQYLPIFAVTPNTIFAVIYYLVVSTLKLGHHHTMMQEHESTETLSAIWWRSLPFILKIHLKCM